MGKLVGDTINMADSEHLSPPEWDKEFIRLHVERENRLAAGQSSPTGWPMERVRKADDGITIPEPKLRLNPPKLPPKKSGWFDEPGPVHGDFLTMDDPWWVLAAYGFTITVCVLLCVLYVFGVL